MDSDRSSREDHSSATDPLAAEDRHLVDGCMRGDRAVQRQLYERYADQVYAVILKMTSNRDEAFDLSQDVFLRVYQRVRGFRGESALGTWIHRVAINTVLSHLRSVRRERAATNEIREKSSPYADTPNPDLNLDLDAVLGDLPEDTRAIVLLRYQQDLCYAEIAEILEISMGTVASRLNRARGQLRERMAGYWGGATEYRTHDAASEDGS